MRCPDHPRSPEGAIREEDSSLFVSASCESVPEIKYAQRAEVRMKNGSCLE